MFASIIMIKGCDVQPSWAYLFFLLVTVSWSLLDDFICVMKPSFISNFDGFQELFLPFFLFVEAEVKRNGKIENVAISDASSLAEKKINN